MPLFAVCVSSLPGAPWESSRILPYQHGLATLTMVKTTPIFSAMPIPKFTLRGFRRPREVAAQALGKLEREVLNEVWRRDEVSVRDVYLAFAEGIAYTTLMTTLDRLFKKRLLTRRKDGRAFIYLPAVSQAEFEQGIREDLIDGLLGQGTEAVEPLLACIVDTVSERDRELLDELDRLIKEKRRELKQRN